MRKSLDFHMKHLCNRRVVVCRWLGCGREYAFEDRKDHEERDCEVCRRREELIAIKATEMTLFACPVGCDLKIPKKDLDRHRYYNYQRMIIMIGMVLSNGHAFPPPGLRNVATA